MFWKFFAALTLTALAFMLGFPIAEVVVHGFNLSLWPLTVRPPGDWFAIMMQVYFLEDKGITPAPKKPVG